MRNLIIASLIFSSFGSAYAQETVCKAQVDFTMVFLPGQVKKTESTIVINPDLNELKKGSIVTITVSTAGNGLQGEPYEYHGSVDTSGSTEQIITYPNTDRTAFKLKILSDNSIQYSARWLAENGEVQGEMHEATYTCQ